MNIICEIHPPPMEIIFHLEKWEIVTYLQNFVLNLKFSQNSMSKHAKYNKHCENDV